MLAHESNSPQEEMPFNQTQFSDSLLLFLLVLSGEAGNTNFNVFVLTRLGMEITTFRTRGEHAHHYTTEEVLSVFEGACKS